ncbi:DUF2510 domain-containing protein [Mycolicibacterium tusciae]|uniref:DUF2510 domain-containing protein n=1 Tax=Mycolicibacterium tusciae TaxID=75922 RepID=UPI00024A3A2E|nr:DUF2510 domain-containing protein [Mycolicibacterium tusciae]
MLYQQARRPFWRRHPFVTGTAALVTFWWLANGWYEAVAVTAIVGLLMFVSRRRKALTIRDAGLRARADYEYRLSLRGDQRGMFGRYPPVQAGWFPDPQNRCQIRYFDGAMWTPHTVRR